MATIIGTDLPWGMEVQERLTKAFALHVWDHEERTSLLLRARPGTSLFPLTLNVMDYQGSGEALLQAFKALQDEGEAFNEALERQGWQPPYGLPHLGENHILRAEEVQEALGLSPRDFLLALLLCLPLQKRQSLESPPPALLAEYREAYHELFAGAPLREGFNYLSPLHSNLTEGEARASEGTYVVEDYTLFALPEALQEAKEAYRKFILLAVDETLEATYDEERPWFFQGRERTLMAWGSPEARAFILKQSRQEAAALRRATRHGKPHRPGDEDLFLRALHTYTSLPSLVDTEALRPAMRGVLYKTFKSYIQEGEDSYILTSLTLFLEPFPSHLYASYFLERLQAVLGPQETLEVILHFREPLPARAWDKVITEVEALGPLPAAWMVSLLQAESLAYPDKR